MDQNLHLTSVTRRLLLSALALATAIITMPPITTAWGGGYAWMVAAGLGLGGGLVWHQRALSRVFEITLILLMKVIFLGILCAVLFHPTEALRSQFASISPGLAIPLVSLFLVFATRRAVRLAGAYYVAALGLGAASLVTGSGTDLRLALLTLYLANAAILAFLVAYARVREQYNLSRSQARSLSNLAYTDPLLGIANRRQLEAWLCEEVAIAERGGQPATLLMFDMDHFKQINDTLGHSAGDQALREVTAAALQVLRATDRIGRWGGDEFVILAPSTDIDQADRLAGRLRESLRQILSPRFRWTTISIGIADCRAGDTPESWLRRADAALYQAKESGRNRVMVSNG